MQLRLPIRTCIIADIDDRHRVEELQTHLKSTKRFCFQILRRLPSLDPSLQVRPFEWRELISVEDADLVVFLGSPESLASDYLMGLATRALKLAECHRTLFVPVEIRRAMWEGSKLGALMRLPRQSLSGGERTKDPHELLATIAWDLHEFLDRNLDRQLWASSANEVLALPKSAYILALKHVCETIDPSGVQLLAIAEASRPELCLLSELWAASSWLPLAVCATVQQGLRDLFLQKLGAMADPAQELEWRLVEGPVPFRVTRHSITVEQVAEALPGLSLDHGGDRDLPLVGCSLPEATLLAALFGGSLPTVDQYQRMGWLDRDGLPRDFPWGDWLDAARSNCRERGRGRVCSVHSHDGIGTSAWGVEDLAGNVWEWTSPTAPYPQTEGNVLCIGGSYADAQRASLWGMTHECMPGRGANVVGFRVVSAV